MIFDASNVIQEKNLVEGHIDISDSEIHTLSFPINQLYNTIHYIHGEIETGTDVIIYLFYQPSDYIGTISERLTGELNTVDELNSLNKYDGVGINTTSSTGTRCSVEWGSSGFLWWGMYIKKIE